MQTESLQTELQDLVELIHIDAPYTIPEELVFDRVVFKYLKGPPRTWVTWRLSKVIVKQTN